MRSSKRGSTSCDLRLNLHASQFALSSLPRWVPVVRFKNIKNLSVTIVFGKFSWSPSTHCCSDVTLRLDEKPENLRFAVFCGAKSWCKAIVLLCRINVALRSDEELERLHVVSICGDKSWCRAIGHCRINVAF